MSNAAKHTPAGTTVTTALTVKAAANNGDAAAGTVELNVTDDGPGIPADLLPTLFERFVRGDSARSHSQGSTSTGLGLAIVEAVTTAHGGQVSVTSRPGRTSFVIMLPTVGHPTGDQPTAGHPTASPPTASPPTAGLPAPG
jgi:two-component system OmpR family sensor kinase